MENTSNSSLPTTPISETSQTSPSAPIQVDVSSKTLPHSSTKLWMFISLILFLIIIIGIVFYLYTYQYTSNVTNSLSTITTNPTEIEKPSLSITPTQPVTAQPLKPNQIVGGNIMLRYSDTWKPVFGIPVQSEYVVYFAQTDQEFNTLVACANTGDCGQYPFKLTGFSAFGVNSASTIDSFAQQFQSSYQAGPLQKMIISGKDALSGFLQADKKTHFTIFDTGSSNGKTFTTVKAVTGSDSSMMDAYLTLLPSTQITVPSEVLQDLKKLSVKNAFFLSLSSSLNTGDTFFLDFILANLLAPQNSTKQYHYFLFTETKKTTSGTPGANYPQDNYLSHDYFLLTDNDQLKAGIYGTPQVKIVLTQQSGKNLENYLSDPKYCEQDTDCLYRSNFCSVGAYNPYHRFYTPWGCGPISQVDDLTNPCTEFGMDVTYDSVKCVENSCKMINPKITCK